jgi:hypothetical protein
MRKKKKRWKHTTCVTPDMHCVCGLNAYIGPWNHHMNPLNPMVLCSRQELYRADHGVIKRLC